nr:hypothetical protein [Roseibaca sp.]
MRYFGANVGPCSSSFSKARFVLNGVTHQLSCCAPLAHGLHRGAKGIFDKLWRVEDRSSERATLIRPDATWRARDVYRHITRYSFNRNGA